MKEQSYKEVIADRDWWREVAAAIGTTLHGWTYRSAATVIRDGRGEHIPGWLAVEIRKLKGLEP